MSFLFVLSNLLSFDFRKTDAVPISSQSNTFTRNGRIQRSSLPPSFYHGDSDATPDFISSAYNACGCVTTRFEIQLPQKPSTRSHTKQRSRLPPSFLSTQSTVVALLPIPATAVMAEAQGPVTVRTPTPGMAMGTETLPTATTEDRFLSLQDTRSSRPPCWFTRPARLKPPCCLQ